VFFHSTMSSGRDRADVERGEGGWRGRAKGAIAQVEVVHWLCSDSGRGKGR